MHSNFRFTRFLRTFAALIVLIAAIVIFAPSACAQQNYISRYDVFAGYSFLDSPHVKLFENGFHLQVGVRPKAWYSLGFDYSVAGGELTLTPNLLTAAWQQQLGGLLQQLGRQGNSPRDTPCRCLPIPSPRRSPRDLNSRTTTFPR